MYQSLPLLEKIKTQFIAKLVDSYFVGFPTVLSKLPLTNPKLYGLNTIKDIPYIPSNLNEHKLDIVQQKKTSKPLPIILYIHGGGFRFLSKDTHWMMAMMFARKGYLVFNINYRLAPKHPFPAALEDCCAAFNWVVDNAHQYGGNIDKLVLAGESAGANLVTSIAVATCTKRPEHFAREVFQKNVVPKAVLPACGLLEVSNPGRFQPTNIRGHMASRILSIIEYQYLPPPCPNLDLANPVVFLENKPTLERSLPPFFIPAGGKDLLVSDTHRLQKALSSLGVNATKKIYPKRDHAFHAFLWLQQARECWEDIFDFLQHTLTSEQGIQKSQQGNHKLI